MTVAGLLGLRWEVVSQLSRVLDDGTKGGIHGPAGFIEAQVPDQAYRQLQKACILARRVKIYVVPGK